MSIRLLAAACAALVLTSAVMANAPAPRPVVTSTLDGKLVVQVDPQVKKPILKVPASLVNPRPQQGSRPGQALLDNPGLLFAGLALTGAFVSGGFWLLRGNRRGVSTLVLCLASMTIAGGSLFADLGIPGLGRRPPVAPQALALPGMVPLTGDVTVQVYNDPFDQKVYLIVPAATLLEKAPQLPQGKPE